MSLRFRQIRYFVEAVDAGSMNKAAGALNLAPNALSLQIRSLEEAFGVRLLDRHPRGVSPTAAGRRFYDDGQQILRLLAQVEERLRASAAEPVVYRIGALPSIIHAVGLKTLRATDPLGSNARIELVEGFSRDLLARLDAGDLHFVIGTGGTGGTAAMDGIGGMDMLREVFVYATLPGNFAAGKAVRLAEIAARGDLAQFGHSSRVWETLRLAADRAHVPLAPACTVESTDFLRRMLRRGLASAVLPLGLVEKEWRAGDLAVHPIAGEPLSRHISLLWRDAALPFGETHAAVRAYARNLIDAYHAATREYTEPVRDWGDMRASARPPDRAADRLALRRRPGHRRTADCTKAGQDGGFRRDAIWWTCRRRPHRRKTAGTALRGAAVGGPCAGRKRRCRHGGRRERGRAGRGAPGRGPGKVSGR